MVKIMMLTTACVFLLFGNEQQVSPELENDCLRCHQTHNIPSEIIYRRYLLHYSSKETIKKKMVAYLTNPSKADSIMPPQFFDKFPPKEPNKLTQERLQQRVDEYILYFDINKKLYTPKEDK